MRSRSPKSNYFFSRPNNVPVQVWSKPTQWFRRCKHEGKRTPTLKGSVPKAICHSPLRLGDKIKGQCLELGLVYKPCLERGRCMNCVWNKVYRLEIYVLTPWPNTCTSFTDKPSARECPHPRVAALAWPRRAWKQNTYYVIHVFFLNRLAFSYKLYFTAYI